MQFHSSKGTGIDVHGFHPHPGMGGRQAVAMSDQRLARRIRAFHRLMKYRRGLLGMHGPEAGEHAATPE